jgi:hypothetical protein
MSSSATSKQLQMTLPRAAWPAGGWVRGRAARAHARRSALHHHVGQPFGGLGLAGEAHRGEGVAFDQARLATLLAAVLVGQHLGRVVQGQLPVEGFEEGRRQLFAAAFSTTTGAARPARVRLA